MMNRRTLIATLGGAAGGGLLSRTEPLLGQPTPAPTPKPVCPPKSGAVDLGALGLYRAPTSPADGANRLKASFLKGVTTADASLTNIPQKVVDHLKAGYNDSLTEKVTNHDFDEDHLKPAAQWVVAIDHAFILGQLAVFFRKNDLVTGKRGPLKPRDVVRAQAKFRRATSSAECACYIDTLKAYQLPAAPPLTGGSAAKKTDDPCSPAGPKPGQIDEECPFCD